MKENKKLVIVEYSCCRGEVDVDVNKYDDLSIIEGIEGDWSFEELDYYLNWMRSKDEERVVWDSMKVKGNIVVMEGEEDMLLFGYEGDEEFERVMGVVMKNGWDSSLRKYSLSEMMSK